MIIPPTEGALRSAVARGGETRFSGPGAITLTAPLVVETNVILEANGFDVTLNGNGITRIFEVRSNVTFAIANLKLNGGYSVYGTETKGGAWGGAIYGDQAIISATRCSFETNWAIGWNEYSVPTKGGAIYNRNGVIGLTNCEFSLNLSASSGSDVSGGAIAVDGGTITVNACRFLSNKIGHVSSFGGGAIVLSNASATIINSEFRGNAGGRDGWPRPSWLTNGAYAGGAIRADGGNLLVSNCLFVANAARSADGTPFPGDSNSEGRAADAHGGALFTAGGTADIKNCYFIQNFASAGKGYKYAANFGWHNFFGGHGKGGAIYTTSRTLIESCSFNKNTALGGNAGGGVEGGSCFGGTGIGGAVYSEGHTMIRNSTFFDNAAVGGDVSWWYGHPGRAKGGCIFATNDTVEARHITIHSTFVKSGIWEPGWHGAFQPERDDTQGAEIYTTNAVFSLLHSILSFGRGSANVIGAIEDQGGNLCSDDSARFTNQTSRSGTDPRLGAFSTYGSMTPTFSLRADSPARDFILSSTCFETDQRGRARPYGMGCDSGASESQPPFYVSGSIIGAGSPVQVVANGFTNLVDADRHFEFANLAAGSVRVSASAENVVFVPLPFELNVQADVGDLEFRAYPRNVLTLESVNGGSIRVVFGGEANRSVDLENSPDLKVWTHFKTFQLDETGGLWSEVSTNDNMSFFRLRMEQ